MFLLAIIGGVMYLLIVSEVSIALGVTAEIWGPPSLPSPEDAGFFDQVLAPIRWGFNAAGSFLQILTFQADIPAAVNTIVVVPLMFGMAYIVWRAVRGGG